MGESIIDEIEKVDYAPNATIKVIGVGGGGCNAVQEMISSELGGVHFICANTDAQALKKSSEKAQKIQLGEKYTRGLGAGANPNVGRESAMESINAIRDAIGESDMVFITAGMGGGTGTGAAPVIAQVAKEANALTVGVVTKPFSFEGPKKMAVAERGIEELKKHVDSLIVIPNDRLYVIASKKSSVKAMFQKANEVLLQGVKSISDVINREGYINTDFADVRTTMLESGLALMGTGVASGENRAHEATLKAINSPLLENVSLESAKAILYNVTTSETNGVTMAEMEEIGKMIQQEAADENIGIIFGFVIDDSLGESLQVTVIATGIEPTEPIEEEIVSESMATVTKFNKPNQSKSSSSRFKIQSQREEAPVINEQPVQPVMDAPLRRTPAYESPILRQTYISRETPLMRSSRSLPGQDSLSYDYDDSMEIPTFIRKTAD